MNYRFDAEDYREDDSALNDLILQVMEVGEHYELECPREPSGSIGGFVGTIRGVRLDNVTIFDRNFSTERDEICVAFKGPRGREAFLYLEESYEGFEGTMDLLRSQYGETQGPTVA